MKRKRYMKRLTLLLLIMITFLSVNLDAKEVNHAPTDIVNISDEILKEVINLNLGNPISQDITYADMESLTDFQMNEGSASEDKLTSLEGMQYATNLSSFLISGNIAIDGIDFSPVTNLTNIDTFIIQMTDLKDISSLEGLQAKVINLGYNQIEDISVIQSFTEAENIELFKSNIKVLPKLKPMPNLQSLTLNQSQIHDISPILDLCNGPTTCAINSLPEINLGSFNNTNLPTEYFLPVVDWEGNPLEVKVDMTNTVFGDNEVKYVSMPNPISSTGDIFGGMVNFYWTYTGNVPIIEGIKDIVINEDEEIDLLAGITAKDVEDGDLTSKKVVDDSKLNVHEPGKYEVLFTVKDSDGNETKSKEIVEVKGINTPTKPSKPSDSNNDNNKDKEVIKEKEIINAQEDSVLIKKLIKTGKENILLVIYIIILVISLRILILIKKV